MIEAQLNMFDAAVILVFLLSTVLAFFRGFVREVLSLGAWIGAAVVTIYAFEHVAEALIPHTSKKLVAYLLAGVGTYLMTLLSISILNAVIIRYLKSGSEVGMLDNFLGLGFGAVRGAFIVSLGYLVLTLVIDEENPPEWVEHAVTRDAAQQGALTLANIAPGYLEEISSLSKELMKGSKDAEGDIASDPAYNEDADASKLEEILSGKENFAPKLDESKRLPGERGRYVLDNRAG